MALLCDDIDPGGEIQICTYTISMDMCILRFKYYTHSLRYFNVEPKNVGAALIW
jgi:hypothetical protein